MSSSRTKVLICEACFEYSNGRDHVAWTELAHGRCQWRPTPARWRTLGGVSQIVWTGLEWGKTCGLSDWVLLQRPIRVIYLCVGLDERRSWQRRRISRSYFVYCWQHTQTRRSTETKDTRTSHTSLQSTVRLAGGFCNIYCALWRILVFMCNKLAT